VKKGSVSLVVAMEIALPRVPMNASILKMKSSIATPLFTAAFGAELFPSPSSMGPAFILAIGK